MLNFHNKDNCNWIKNIPGKKITLASLMNPAFVAAFKK
jgi:hypothetical protein